LVFLSLSLLLPLHSRSTVQCSTKKIHHVSYKERRKERKNRRELKERESEREIVLYDEILGTPLLWLFTTTYFFKSGRK